MRLISTAKEQVTDMKCLPPEMRHWDCLFLNTCCRCQENRQNHQLTQWEANSKRPMRRIMYFLIFIYLFLAVLGLRCCGGFSLVVASGGCCLVAEHGL